MEKEATVGAANHPAAVGPSSEVEITGVVATADIALDMDGPITCFRCDKPGHKAAYCTNPPKGARGGDKAEAPHGTRGSAPSGSKELASSAVQTARKNRFEPLSSDD